MEISVCFALQEIILKLKIITNIIDISSFKLRCLHIVFMHDNLTHIIFSFRKILVI